MARINPTRINLINTKKDIAIARKGYGLLKRKREVLVLEFMKLLKLTGSDRRLLESQLANAYEVVALSSAYVGDFRLGVSASGIPDSTSVRIEGKNIMGVHVPEIEMLEPPSEKVDEYTSLISSNVAEEDIEDAFAEVKKTIIEVVKREQGLRRLVLEIDKTKRRVNALEYIIIPGLHGRARYISMRLEEIERDTFSALKHVKKRLAKAAA